MPSVAVILALCFLNRQTQSQSPPQGQRATLSQISHLNVWGCKDLTINSFLACDCWGARQNAVIMSTSLDPLLFPFRPNLGVHDATIYMLQRVYACLDSNSCIMRITFDFSRALNTIHLLLLREKLRKNISKQVNYHTVYWLADTGCSMWDRAVWFGAVQELHGGLCCLHSCSPCTPQNFNISESFVHQPQFFRFYCQWWIAPPLCTFALRCGQNRCIRNIFKKCKTICKEKYYKYAICLLCVIYFLIVLGWNNAGVKVCWKSDQISVSTKQTWKMKTCFE